MIGREVAREREFIRGGGRHRRREEDGREEDVRSGAEHPTAPGLLRSHDVLTEAKELQRRFTSTAVYAMDR